MASISSTNAVMYLGIASIYPVPQKMGGWAVDDMYSVEGLEVAETKMGVDGRLSAGLVNAMVPMDITLQADSAASILFFDTWFAQQKAAQDVFWAFGTIRVPSVGKAYVMTNGILKRYVPLASAKKTLEPLKYGLVWETVIGAPI